MDGSEQLPLSSALVEALAESLAEPLAHRVVEILRTEAPSPTGDPPRRWLTAKEVAQRLGVTRRWVYEHASELGARRIGSGPRPRLRFWPEAVTAAVARPNERRIERLARRTSHGGLIEIYDG
jgi:hypothetical protein